ncbi:MAG: branched-chain amino acid transport system II carrier protein [Chlamydiia bacterium]|nr:branched-chain amino acid transport system II carrier protein [Chlamydiia bacterium]
MKNKILVLSTGLAMFSMFFGSGNLVFPILVGKMAEGHFGLASLGILLTGVVVPFLGILAMLLFNGNSNEFFSRLGKPALFWFPLIALSLMGPFGVLARCITVAHGAFRLIFADTPLWAFSIVTCAALFFLAIRKNRIVPILGTLLTPLLLLSLAAIVWFAIEGNSIPTESVVSGWGSLKEGLLQGYQTMDLLAAFFFSAFIIRHLREKNQGLPTFFKAALIGASLLAAIYFSLVLLGAMYAPMLHQVPPQEMFGFIAQKALGSAAVPIVCTAVILACMTTAVVLTSLFADFFRKEVVKDKISPSLSLVITLGIACLVSTLEFSGIAKILGPLMEIMYPALITLTLCNIAFKLWGWKQLKMPTAIAVVLKLISSAI